MNRLDVARTRRLIESLHIYSEEAERISPPDRDLRQVSIGNPDGEKAEASPRLLQLCVLACEILCISVLVFYACIKDASDTQSRLMFLGGVSTFTLLSLALIVSGEWEIARMLRKTLSASSTISIALIPKVFVRVPMLRRYLLLKGVAGLRRSGATESFLKSQRRLSEILDSYIRHQCSVSTITLNDSLRCDLIERIIGDVSYGSRSRLEEFVKQAIAFDIKELGERGTNTKTRGANDFSFEESDQLFLAIYSALPHALRGTCDDDLRRIGGSIGGSYSAAQFIFTALTYDTKSDCSSNENLVSERLTINALELLNATAALDPNFLWVPSAEWLAERFSLIVKVRTSTSLDACLVVTHNRTVIWVADHLPPVDRSRAILHELAHWLLDHTPNTVYGLNPDRISDRLELARFERQEREANAFAAALEYGLKAFILRSHDPSALAARNAA